MKPVATLLPIISHIEADNVMAKNELSLLIQKTKSIYLATVIEEINSHRTNQQKIKTNGEVRQICIYKSIEHLNYIICYW